MLLFFIWLIDRYKKILNDLIIIFKWKSRIMLDEIIFNNKLFFRI